MKTIVTNDYLSTLVSSLHSRPAPVNDWQADTRYSEGTKVRNGTKIYLAFTTGTSSKVAPSHASGKSVDGTVTWMFAYDVPSRRVLSESLYLAFGDGGPWKDEPTPDDVSDDFTDGAKAAENTIALFRLLPGDLSLGVERILWENNTVIPEWPSVHSYVIVDKSVYRCISNNGGAASTTEPSGVSLTNFELADGYVWKYLGDISPAQDGRFGQTGVFPIAALYVDDGSARYLIQSTAKNGGISGFKIVGQTGVMTSTAVKIYGDGTGATGRADLNPFGNIRRIVATNPGENYTHSGRAYAVVREADAPGNGATASATIAGGELTAATIVTQGTGYLGGAIAIVTGDGTGAEISVNVASGYVVGLTIDNPGSGYTECRVTIVPGEAGAVGEAIMAPIGGHGRDMTKELPVEYIMINRRLNSLDSLYIPDGKIRQISLMSGIRPLSGLGDILAGPKHPAATGKNLADMSECRAILVNNIEAIEHTNDQYEEINLTARLAK